MSRIFDALQRSGLEQTGVEYPDLVAIATKVLDAPQAAAPQGQVAADDPGEFPKPSIPISKASPLGQLVVEELAAEEPDKFSPSIIPNSEGSSRGILESVQPAFRTLDVDIPISSRLVFFTEPHSLAAEKFRFLGVRLRQLRQGRTLKKVLVTSTIPEEGKSLVAANLAGVLARRKERVLLIEGDMRRPNLASRFGLPKLSGLAESLQNTAHTGSNIYCLGSAHFWLMPAGDPPANPLELIQSERLSQLMEQLVPLFDWIIIDSPPLLPLADTTVWQRFVDGALLVVREGTTQKNALQRGIDALKKGDLLGVVLNGSSNTSHHDYYQRYSQSLEQRAFLSTSR